MVFNSGDFKNEVSFAFRINSDPPKVCLGSIIGGGEWGEGGLRPIYDKRLCDISILGLSIMLISKMRWFLFLGYL